MARQRRWQWRRRTRRRRVELEVTAEVEVVEPWIDVSPRVQSRTRRLRSAPLRDTWASDSSTRITICPLLSPNWTCPFRVTRCVTRVSPEPPTFTPFAAVQGGAFFFPRIRDARLSQCSRKCDIFYDTRKSPPILSILSSVSSAKISAP